MDSFTSHFKAWIPRQTCGLLCAALFAWVACVFYLFHMNPEVTHYLQGEKIKDGWARKMTAEHGAKIVVYGGSSCQFSIDGERMLRKFNLPTVNDGRSAGMGASMMTESELARVRSGDTLIIALEPGTLTGSIDPTSLAAQFSATAGHPEWVLRPALGIGSINLFEFAVDLRPGGRFLFTMLGKRLMGRPAFRYKLSDIRASGWAQTDVRMSFEGSPGHGDHLSKPGRQLVVRLRDWCQSNQVRVAYSLPWAYSPVDQAAQFRRHNACFLGDMAALVPVLKDPGLGADTNRDDFADTNFHLATPAAEARTDQLARQILNWDLWTVDELTALAKP